MPRIAGAGVSNDLTPACPSLGVKGFLSLGGPEPFKEGNPEAKGLTFCEGTGKAVSKPRAEILRIAVNF